MREEKLKHIQCKKTLAGFLIVCYVLSLVTLFVPIPEVSASITNTREFKSSSSDGYIYAIDPDYNDLHDLASSEYVIDYSNIMQVGQSLAGGTGYYMFRAFVFFDTSALPDGATIDSAYLSLFVATDWTDTNFDVTLQNDPEAVFPHDSMVAVDYYYDNYVGTTTTNGGERNTSEMTVDSYFNITLSTEGKAYIVDDSTTKFAVVSGEDIDESAPIGKEYFNFYQQEAGSGYEPLLTITYTVETASLYDYTFIGPYIDNGGASSDSVTCTIVQSFNETESFSLDGAGGVDTVVKSYEQQAVSVIWNITTVENVTRSIYFTDVTSETIYISIPDSDDLVYLYTFSVTDLYGMTNAYLEVLSSGGAESRVIQRFPLDYVNPLPYYLVFGELYYIRIVCDQGSSILGSYTALTEANQNLVVGAGSFPATSYVLGTVVYAIRQNNTWIQANYTDSAGKTSWVYVSIKYRDADGDYVTAYSVNNTGNSVIVNWYYGTGDRDYITEVYAYYDGSVRSWGFQCPHDPEHTNPFVDLNDLDPTGTFPIEPQYLIGTVILLFGIGFASYANVAMGAWVAFGFGLFLTFLGWLPSDPIVTPVVLGFAGVLAGLLSLSQWKRKERFI